MNDRPLHFHPDLDCPLGLAFAGEFHVALVEFQFLFEARCKWVGTDVDSHAAQFQQGSIFIPATGPAEVEHQLPILDPYVQTDIPA